MFDKNFMRKARNTGRFLQKSLGEGGNFLKKAASVGNQVLDEADKIVPGLGSNPLMQAARTAVALTGIAGSAASGLSQAKSIQDVGGSLKDAYRGYTAAIAPSPAPGLETAASVVD
jgi:hypothetical protein